jgi:hypothetical protein
VALLTLISSPRHEHTTTIAGRPANDTGQHARQRRAVARSEDQRNWLPAGLLQCNTLGVGGAYGVSPVSELDPWFRVAVRASADGRFTFQIFTLSGEPRTFHADSQTYATPADAAQAGYDAIAAAQYRKS